MTAEQLLDTPGLGRCELLRGELVMMSPAGFEHGRIALEIGSELRDFVKPRGLGIVTGAETGFIISRDPDTVRAPDVAVLRADRVPPTPLKGFFPGPPDLAVEVVSPGDRANEVLAKIHDWLDAGCHMVWVVDPQTKTVTVYHSRRDVVVLGMADTLTGSDVLPGFTLPVARIFGL